MTPPPPPRVSDTDIAIVGMAAHLPGARDVAQYWANLKEGLRSIRRLDEAELRAAGEAPHLLRHPDYVPFAAPLDGFEMFDGEFFGFGPKESAILDPQHRRFLEVAWEALENAGHMPEDFPGPVGVFAGCGMGSYFWVNICSNPDLVDNVGMFLLRHTGNDKDFLATRLSHVLDLKGPSINLQTACSTSLVATHYACQSLLNGECDMALAGGVTIELPQGRGYLHKEGEILSPDGECHAFDHRAQGTVFGSGAGVVVLRRLADAMADGDHVWAVIKGSAVNNDGAQKAGYLAPSVEGQAAAVAEAQAVAGVTSDNVDYVECHGTGTYLGDPIEVAALTSGFRQSADTVGTCRIGSVKTNIGHLDTAAGVASLIKTALAVHEGQMPPSLGFEAPNPAIDFEHSPFRVNDRLTPWPETGRPRRAGVNSLGVGGTNAHLVLEQAPERAESEPSDWPFQLLTLSARSKAALDGNAARLAAHLRAHPEQDLADVAWTLKEGRRAFDRRRVVVAESHEEAAALLEANDPRRVFTHEVMGEDPEVTFMFPGGGAQYAGMARDLYETEPVFRDWMERGLDHLQAQLDYDIRRVWLPEPGEEEQAAARLRRPSVQLPLIMITEYALARLWMGWGVQPAALIGHSMGENTAACLAGVMSFEDCIDLVALRGRLFDRVPAGGMLTVSLPAEELRPYLGDTLDLASDNAPGLSVASGPQAALDDLKRRLRADGHEAQRVQIDIAAHSRMLDPILEEFRAFLATLDLQPPRIPIVSNLTGAMLSPEEATDPDYWVRHLRGTVRFADGMARLSDRGADRVYLEVGPGKTLASLAGAQPGISPNQVIGSLRHKDDHVADDRYFMAMLGRMWAVGVTIDWAQIWAGARRNRVVLPSYAFQQAPYFIEPGKQLESAEPPLTRHDDISDWGWKPVWRPHLAECELDVADLSQLEPHSWLVFMDEEGLADRVTARLREAGQSVTEVRAGDAFARTERGYVISPERGREDYDRLVQDLAAQGHAPDRVAQFWLVTGTERFRPGSSFFHRTQEQGFYALLFLAQAMAEEGLPPCHLTAFTTGAARVRDEPLPYPGKSTIHGPLRVLPREMPGTTCMAVDLQLPDSRRGRDAAMETLATQVLEDLAAPPRSATAALRGAKRYEQVWRPAPLRPEAPVPALRDGGTYLLTGGFGGVSLALAEDLIARHGANIVLLARSALPAPEDRLRHLETHGPHAPLSRRIAALQRLEARAAEAGGAVMVLQGDVSNVEDMAAARASAEARFGRIDGVFHAAGRIDDAPLLSKSAASIEDVLTPKLHGTQVLEQVFPDGDLDLLVLFSSSSTATAPAGQVDYVAANEYLNALATARAGGMTRVVALDWGIWAEVGMAAEALADRDGRAPEAPRVPVEAPLIDWAGFDRDGARVFGTRLGTDRWVLDEHRTTDGHALLPGTGYLELAAEALRAQGESGGFEIRDLYFLRALEVPSGSGREARVTLTRRPEGYAMQVRSDTRLAGRDGFVLNAEATLSLVDLTAPPRIDLDALRDRVPLTETARTGGALRAAQAGQLDFGPRWQVLRGTGMHGSEGLAHLALPQAFGSDLDGGYLLHPALMDIATGWAMGLVPGYAPDHLWVPVSYESVRVHAPLPAEIWSHVRLADAHGPEATTASFDVTLCDPTGRVLVEVEGFAVKRMEAGHSVANLAAPAPSEVVFDDDRPGTDRPLTPAEERLRHNLTQGIRPDEGPEALRRALALGLPQVLVSSLDLPALVRQAGMTDAAPDSAPGFDRPELASDYAAPETEVERTLAGFWSDLLGVAEPGVEDSFFDLGGHSLIAVRLFAMIRRTYRVDFPISILFEAPTIRACAALIEERIGPQQAEGDKPKSPARRYTHLVPMHEGEGGPKTPFFLVAGMFGNVLNLRHLAHLLGDDRRFYGLQARGLMGEAEPHRDLVEAARDYIAELRQVQPHGPYLLGGFSGGGITAYEMARQLREAGEEVALLVLLDTPLPRRRPLAPRDRAAIQWQELRAGGLAYPFRWAARRIRWEIAKRRGGPAEAPEQPAQFHDTAIEAAFYEAIARYEVAPWDGPVKLFRPPLRGKWQVPGGLVNSERAYVLPDNDWSGHVPGIEVFEVPGDHDSMVLEPNVRVLAARIRRCIEAAEAQPAEAGAQATTAPRDAPAQAAE
ncbi:SDR family oxidoreductase [Aquicoccus sp. SCR17]|nr:SDR family oxidoreductase [Carideicomes alvinocaridis]